MSRAARHPLELLEALVGRFQEAGRRRDDALDGASAAHARAQAELWKRREENEAHLSRQRRAERTRLGRDQDRALARIDEAHQYVHGAVDDEGTKWLEARSALEYRLDRVLAVCDDLAHRHGRTSGVLLPRHGMVQERWDTDFPLTVRGLYDEIVALYWGVIQTRRALGTATSTNNRRGFTPAPTEESR